MTILYFLTNSLKHLHPFCRIVWSTFPSQQCKICVNQHYS